MIYTSYFANLKKIPDTITPIAICGKVPQFYNGLTYKKLAPKYSFFVVWKQTHDNDYYIQQFQNLVLDISPNFVAFGFFSHTIGILFGN